MSRVLQRPITSKTISQELGSVNLLSMYGGTYSENLPSKLNKEYPDQGHFYRVNVNYLEEMLLSRYGPIIYMRFQLCGLLIEEKERKLAMETH